MPYYKTASGEVYFLDDESMAYLLPEGAIAITESEADTLRSIPPAAIQAQKNDEARAYLAETDWYVIRFLEAGTPVPADISTARADARAAVITI